MLAVDLVSPSAVIYKLDDVAYVTSDTDEQDALGPGMHYFGVIIARSIPPELVRVQQQQSAEPRWKLIVHDGTNTFEFTNVWFHANPYRNAQFRIDFGSQAGPENLHLSNPK